MGVRLYIAKHHEVIWDFNGYFNHRNEEVLKFIHEFSEDTGSMVGYSGDNLYESDEISVEASSFKKYIEDKNNPIANTFKKMIEDIKPNSNGEYYFTWI